MGIQRDISEILTKLDQSPLIDVRTPSEFCSGHIPSAINIPLFSDEERAEVGTLYKQKGADVALKRGLDFVGPKMRSIAEKAETIAINGKISVHCWRGGKRSESVSWLLGFNGLDVSIVKGGYKAYRRLVHEYLDSDFKLIVLGGRTGSAKTPILLKLVELGEQVVDLEGLANHKGSAFGWIGEHEQPQTEHFENLLFDSIRHLDKSKRIWVENESKSIGRVHIPDGFWNTMKDAPLIHLEVPLKERVKHLVSLYAANNPSEALIQSFQKIERRLGGLRLKNAIESIQQGDYATAAEIALVYYDKAYDYGLDNNPSPNIEILKVDALDIPNIAAHLTTLETHKAK